MQLIDYIVFIVQIFWGVCELIIALRNRSPHKQYEKSFYKMMYAIIYFSIAISVFVGDYLQHNNIFNLYHSSAILKLTAIGLIIVGMIIRFVAIGSLKKYFTVNLAVSEGQKLITNGMYSVIRHPAYTGSMIAFIGFGVSFGNIVSIIFSSIPCIILFLIRISNEEKLLMETFGAEYKTWQSTTKKLIPFIY